MEVQDESEMLSERLRRLLEQSGSECTGLSGEQALYLLGSLCAQLEATLYATLPRAEHDAIESYLESARPLARQSTLMTLEIERTNEA